MWFLIKNYIGKLWNHILNKNLSLWTHFKIKCTDKNKRKVDKRVSGQLLPKENCPPVRVGVLVKVRVIFRVGGQPDNCLRRKLPPV